MTSNILIIDDDRQITGFLKKYLEKQGFRAFCASSGREMFSTLEKKRIDLCILDVGLPDADGFQLTRKIRNTSAMPIIILSERDEAFDRIFGLEFGADDYITKPFEPRELVARIRTVLRRTNTENLNSQASRPGQTLLRFGPWIANLGERTLVHAKSGKDAGLTSMEFDLVRAFIEQPKVVLNRDRLLELTRGNGACVGDRAIDVHIMRLRKKIEDDPSQPRFIKTIHGIGYCMSEDVSRITG